MKIVNSVEYNWGWEMICANTPLYHSRFLIIKEGESLPYLYHKRRDKTIIVLQGVVRLVIEGKNKVLNERERYHIPPKLMHQIIAIKGDANILETGTKFEDDVVIVKG